MNADFTLNDFRKQFDQIVKLGRRNTISRMPGMAEMLPEGVDPAEALGRIRGMIDSMTEEERRNPDIIDSERRFRIARLSGTQPHEVKTFLDQFAQLRELMRRLASQSLWQRLKTIMRLGRSAAAPRRPPLPPGPELGGSK